MASRMLFAALSGVGTLTLVHAAPALAQSDTVNSADIVVTARRVEERLQDVPVSISVISQQQLANRNISNGADLAISTPSLSVANTTGSLVTSYVLRGFSSAIGTDPTVGVYFADAVSLRGGTAFQQSGNGAGPGSYFDLQNIQVLKGPQGTLFGRNSTGGAILLVPQKPTGEFGGYLEASYGNYAMYRAQGVLNIPLGDKARLRVGVDRMKRDGYLRNVTNIGQRAFNDVDYIAARASLVVDLTPNLENYMIASYQYSNTNGDMLHIFRANTADANAGVAAILAAAQLARYGNADDSRTTVNGFEGNFVRSVSWQVINTTTWRASDDLTVKNIAMYGELKNSGSNPYFGNAFEAGDLNFIFGTNYGPGTIISFAPTNSYPGLDTAQEYTVSDELRLEGTSFEGAFKWQGGGFFEYAGPLGRDGALSPALLFNCQPGTLRCATPYPGGFVPGVGVIAAGGSSATIGSTRYRNVGVYAQGTYDLTKQLSLTVGARYTWARVTNDAQLISYAYPFSPTTPVEPFFGSCVLVTSRPDCVLPLAQSSQAPTWTVGLDYHPTEDILTYAKWSRGFRQGGVAAVRLQAVQNFREEKVDAYEVGLKTTFRGAIRGTFNVAAFYNDLSNQQLQISITAPRNPEFSPSVAVLNAGQARTYGGEVDASLSLFERLVIEAHYAYVHSRIRALTLPAFNDPIFEVAPVGRVGDRLPYTPEHQLVVTGSYMLPLNESLGSITLSASYIYTSDQVFNATRRGPNQIADGPGPISGSSIAPERNLVDASINWNRVGGSKFDLTVFGSNIFDKKYPVYSLDFAGGFQGTQPGLPRLYGVRVRYNF